MLGILIPADYVFQVNLKCTVNQISMEVLVSNLCNRQQTVMVLHLVVTRNLQFQLKHPPLMLLLQPRSPQEMKNKSQMIVITMMKKTKRMMMIIGIAMMKERMRSAS